MQVITALRCPGFRCTSFLRGVTFGLGNAARQRFIGTQTPLWRTRQLAHEKTSAAVAARRSGLGLPPPRAGSGEVQDTAASADDLAARAHVAALEGKALECLTLVWALRDLPREVAVRQAVNKQRGEQRTTLLQAASTAGLEESVKMLTLELGARAGAKDATGRSALHMAVEKDHLGVAQVLLANGRAHVEARDARGQTPLHLAAELGCISSGRLLLHFGANPESTDCDGKTPLDLAKSSGKLPLDDWSKELAELRVRSDESPWQGVKDLGTELPSHIVAPPLRNTPIGYMPLDENGEMIQLARGIRCNKRRKGPSYPRKSWVNWYAPRG